MDNRKSGSLGQYREWAAVNQGGGQGNNRLYGSGGGGGGYQSSISDNNGQVANLQARLNEARQQNIMVRQRVGQQILQSQSQGSGNAGNGGNKYLQHFGQNRSSNDDMREEQYNNRNQYNNNIYSNNHNARLNNNNQRDYQDYQRENRNNYFDTNNPGRDNAYREDNNRYEQLGKRDRERNNNSNNNSSNNNNNNDYELKNDRDKDRNDSRGGNRENRENNENQSKNGKNYQEKHTSNLDNTTNNNNDNLNNDIEANKNKIKRSLSNVTRVPIDKKTDEKDMTKGKDNVKIIDNNNNHQNNNEKNEKDHSVEYFDGSKELNKLNKKENRRLKSPILPPTSPPTYINDLSLLTADITKIIDENKILLEDKSKNSNNDIKIKEQMLKNLENTERRKKLRELLDFRNEKSSVRLPLWKHKLTGEFDPPKRTIFKGKILFQVLMIIIIFLFMRFFCVYFIVYLFVD